MTHRDAPHLLRILEERLLHGSLDPEEPGPAALLADDFYEIGSSGRLYDKAETLNRLNDEARRDGAIRDFQVRFVAPEVALVVYLLMGTEEDEPAAPTWHSSIWQYHHGRWQIRFHQGTPAAGPAVELASFLP